MDHSRYLAYRSALRALDRLPYETIDEHARERLTDTAEGLLLTTDADEAESLRSDAAVVLSLLVIQRRWDHLSADVLWHAIADCGPPEPQPRQRRTRALTFAGAL